VEDTDDLDGVCPQAARKRPTKKKTVRETDIVLARQVGVRGHDKTKAGAASKYASSVVDVTTKMLG
jgi:hypothetical protein